MDKRRAPSSPQVLEKHHVLRAFEVMVGEDIGLLKGLSAESYWNFRNNVASCILATDFAKHPAYCEQVGPFLIQTCHQEVACIIHSLLVEQHFLIARKNFGMPRLTE